MILASAGSWWEVIIIVHMFLHFKTTYYDPSLESKSIASSSFFIPLDFIDVSSCEHSVIWKQIFSVPLFKHSLFPQSWPFSFLRGQSESFELEITHSSPAMSRTAFEQIDFVPYRARVFRKGIYYLRQIPRKCHFLLQRQFSFPHSLNHSNSLWCTFRLSQWCYLCLQLLPRVILFRNIRNLLEETNMTGLRRVCDIPISLPTV